MEYHQLSITRACKVVQLPKSMFYYKSSKDDAIVIDKLKELAEKNSRKKNFGLILLNNLSLLLLGRAEPIAVKQIRGFLIIANL